MNAGPAWLHGLNNPLRRVLECLDVTNRRLQTYFEPPPPGESLGDALLHHFNKLYKATAHEPVTRRIVAAGLLSLGDLNQVNTILAALPRARVVTDHGAGRCALVANFTVAAMLPIPEPLRRAERWIEGSSEAVEIRQWFAEQHRALEWSAEMQCFTWKSEWVGLTTAAG